MNRTHVPNLIALTAVIVLLGTSGCVRRRLTVRSEPAGALVYVDRQLIGTTPVSHAFTYYGTRHFEIVLDGYRTETFLRTFNPPWYELPPLDFVSENLWPFEKRDMRVVDIAMIPDPNVPSESLLASAEQLRTQASQGIAIVPNSNAGPYTDPTIPIVRPETDFNAPLPPTPGFFPRNPGPAQVLPAPPAAGPSPFFQGLREPFNSIPSTAVTPGGSYRPPVQP